MDNSDAIREILLRDWDPFCVGDNPHLRDEYDNLISGVVGILNNQSDFNTLNAYLQNIEKQMDAPVSDECRERTVKALLNL